MDMPWYVNNTLLILLFVAQHSIGTTPWAKGFISKLAGNRPYAWNAIYNLGTFACIGVIIAFWKTSGVDVWVAPEPWYQVLIGVEILALIAFFYLFKFTQPFGEWIGYSQLIKAARGVPEPKGEGYKIKTFGIKRYVRFPHHTMLIVMFWALPVMTLDLMLFAVEATIYTWLGSLHQDFRGRSYFGEHWVAYTRTSRMLFPAIEHVAEDLHAWLTRDSSKSDDAVVGVLPKPRAEGG